MDKKGGWSMNRVCYSPGVRLYMLGQIKGRRPFVHLPVEAIRGTRFNDDEAVAARIESNYTEVEFMECPGLAVEAMLIDVASSDWWYKFEKSYDDEREETEGHDDED